MTQGRFPDFGDVDLPSPVELATAESTAAEPAGGHTIYTVGHSTHALEEWVAILQAHQVEALADVRRFPGSRRYPQFNVESLTASLPTFGIQYLPFPGLGGRRQASRESVNVGWRNEGFRGYADYMQTPAFAEALGTLIAVAMKMPTAIMCAEAVPWRCHRSLIADALLIRGWRVLDIFGPAKATAHALTPFARVEGTEIIYPAEERGEEAQNPKE